MESFPHILMRIQDIWEINEKYGHYGIVVKRADSKVIGSGFSQYCYLLAIQFLAGCLISPCFSFLICKMGLQVIEIIVKIK